MARSEWNDFVESVPWLTHRHASVDVDDDTESPRVESIRTEFPLVDQLLASASATRVTLDEHDLQLLTWGAGRGALHWLCAPPTPNPPLSVCESHRRLLRTFGGVIERSSNEPVSWLLNCDDALTERESARDGSVLHDYAWIMEDHGGEWPIDPLEHYSICAEANGNTTLCNRSDGSVLLFAGPSGTPRPS